MKLFPTFILACTVILSGCSTVPNPSPGKLAVQVTTLLGMPASEHDVRIQVDGRFVGNYNPEGTVQV